MTTPLVAFKKSRPKTSSRLKVQQAYDDDDAAGEEDAPSSIVRPKKVISAVSSRPTFKSAASRRTESAASSAPASDDEDRRPAARSIYSSEYLASLQASTPSTPKDFKSDPLASLPTKPDETRIERIAVPDARQIQLLKQRREHAASSQDDFIALDSTQRVTTTHEDDFSPYEESGSRVMFGKAEAALQDRLRKTQIEDAYDTLQDTYDAEINKPDKPAITLLSESDASSSDENDTAWEATQVKKATVQRTVDVVGLEHASARAVLAGTDPQMTSTGLLSGSNSPGVRTFRGPPIPTLTPLATFPQMLSAMQAKLASTRSKLQQREERLAELELELAGMREEEGAIKGKLEQASVDYERLRLQVGGIDAL